MSAGNLCLQSAIGAPSGQVKIFRCRLDRFNRKSIDSKSAEHRPGIGGGVDGLPTGGTSKPAVESVDVPDNHRMIICRSSAGLRRFRGMGRLSTSIVFPSLKCVTDTPDPIKSHPNMHDHRCRTQSVKCCKRFNKPATE